jgi:hypothetical protein
MSGQLDHLDPGAVGVRVRIVRRLSGLTSKELRHRLNSRSAGLVTQLERGEAGVIERISEIANACAGEWALRETTPHQIIQYLNFERDEVPISWPRRVEIVRRLSGLTGSELAHRLGSTSASPTSHLVIGQSRRVREIANAVAGEGLLENVEPKLIGRFLHHEINELPIKSGE